MSEEQKREPRKQCSQCQDYKLTSEFFKEKKKPMGLQSRCKLCHTAGVRAWKEERRLKEEAEEELKKASNVTPIRNAEQ